MSVRSVLTFLLVFCGLVAVVVPVSMAHFHWSASGASEDQRRLASDGSAMLPQYPAAAITCTGEAKSTASHAAMQDIADHAQMLGQQHQTEEALSRYDDLQQLDPGFPGLHLDRATALMEARRYDDALGEVNRQVSISQCLERLPATALIAYCQREMPNHTPTQCRAEMQTFLCTAHFQAAVAQMQLGRSTGRDALANAATPSTSASLLPDVTQPEEHLPKRMSDKPAHRAAGTAKQQHGNADALASAEGTDAALGAYSR